MILKVCMRGPVEAVRALARMRAPYPDAIPCARVAALACEAPRFNPVRPFSVHTLETKVLLIMTEPAPC